MINKGRFILILILIYYCLPKVDLFLIPGSLTGIRIQDFIALIIFSLLFKIKIKLKTSYVVFLLSVHTLYSVVIWGNFQGIIGTFRLVEYYSIGLGIYYLIQAGLFDRFIKTSFTLLFCSSILQFLLVIPNIDPGRGLVLSHQFSGPFGTPAELSYFVVASVYLYNQVHKKTSPLSWIALLVMFNGVKAVIIGFLVINWANIRSLNIILRIVISTAMLISVYLGREMLFAAVEFLSVVYENIFISNATFADLKNGGGNQLEESSLSNRLGKWISSLSIMYQLPVGSTFGFGVYSQGGALDGGILRFLYEFGILIFIPLMIHLLRVSFTYVLILLSVNFLFDAYMSSVVMPMLLAVYHYLTAEKNDYASRNY